MRRYVILLAFLLLGVFFMNSCSIKEDRTPCPCWLDIFFNSFPDEGIILSGYSLQRVFNEGIDKNDFMDYVEYMVPRSMLCVTAYKANTSISPIGTNVMIQKGSQADSLYAHCSMVDCSGEFAIDTVSLHKQFATVYLKFENSEGELINVYDVIVKGHVNGIDLMSLRPTEGEFEFRPKDEGNHLYVFRLPRQSDDSLLIDLYKEDYGEYVDTIDVGMMIGNSGYDWRAKDLNDIIISIDFAKMGLEVNVMEWDSKEIYDVTI